MKPDLPPAAIAVLEAARGLGLEIEIRQHAASTRTAEEAAIACGCEVAQIVKSLVFAGRDSGRPVLILVSGANRVDEALAGASVGETLVRPDAKAVRAWTGFAIGGIPPFGHAAPLRTFIDESLLGFAQVWAAAGTPTTVFAIAPQALTRAIGAVPLRIS